MAISTGTVQDVIDAFEEAIVAAPDLGLAVTDMLGDGLEDSGPRLKLSATVYRETSGTPIQGRASKIPGVGQLTDDLITVTLVTALAHRSQKNSRSDLYAIADTVRSRLSKINQFDTRWVAEVDTRPDETTGKWFAIQQSYRTQRFQELGA